MDTSGLATMEIRPNTLKGQANEDGEFKSVNFVISKSLKSEAYLSYDDLVRIGSELSERQLKITSKVSPPRLSAFREVTRASTEQDRKSPGVL